MSPESQGERGTPQVSVIVPARNEEDCLGDCLQSLAAQTGVEFEVIVVDDQSTDRTREIAEQFLVGKTPALRGQVISAGTAPQGWSGKCNALRTGTRLARGEWLLFTDADTVHLPGSMKDSLEEAQRDGLALLSYSPEQEVRGLLQWAVMPVIFAELASTYRPAEIADARSPAAAANGQYLLISREAYDAVGGHEAVATSLLEDVELARLVKRSGRRVRLRHGQGLVRTRMYRNTRALIEGWSKNLDLLFPWSLELALRRLGEFAAIVLGSVALGWLFFHRDALTGVSTAPLAFAGLGLLAWLRVQRRVIRAHSGMWAQVVAPLGLPIFSYLLLRSRFYYRWRGRVIWKGRAYCPSIPQSSNESRRAATSVGGARSSI